MPLKLSTLFYFSLSLSLTFRASLAASIVNARNSIQPRSSGDPTVVDIWSFPQDTWVENLAVRSNGQLLVTLLSSPEVYQVDPTLQQPPTLVHRFDGHLACAGIVELGTDVFYVVVSNFSTVTITTGPGTYSVWKLNLTEFDSGGGTIPAVHIANFPDSVFFNGMTAIPNSEYLLIADSRGSSNVWSLNVATGAVNGTITNSLMAGLETGEDIGINGVKVWGQSLYWTNTDQALLGKIAINAEGDAVSTATTVTSGLTSVDDFVFDSTGNVYFAGNDEVRYKATGSSTFTVISNNTLLSGSTAVKFGRLSNDRNDLYVTTNGGAAQFETKDFTSPGKVVKVVLWKVRLEGSALNR